MESRPTPSSRPLRIVFFGTPEVAVPTLERLIAGPFEVVGVVSQPDRGRGRGKKVSPSPVSRVALREEIPLLRPERVGDDETVAALHSLGPDLGVVVAFGQFLPKKVRELPGEGYLINAHASLLPKLRGAAPIARAILDGETETGISVMRIEREMDAGPVALVRSTPIGKQENTAELTERLARLAADAIEEAVDQIARGEIEWTEQDPSLATHAEKITKADATLDLRESARAIAHRIHALAPKPGGTLRLLADEGEVALKVARADVQPYTGEVGGTAEGGAHTGPIPGTTERGAQGAALRIATGDGWLVPLVLQRPGGKALAIDDFLRGYAIPSDARFASTPPEASNPEATDPSAETESR